MLRDGRTPCGPAWKPCLAVQAAPGLNKGGGVISPAGLCQFRCPPGGSFPPIRRGSRIGDWFLPERKFLRDATIGIALRESRLAAATAAVPVPVVIRHQQLGRPAIGAESDARIARKFAFGKAQFELRQCESTCNISADFMVAQLPAGEADAFDSHPDCQQTGVMFVVVHAP